MEEFPEGQNTPFNKLGLAIFKNKSGLHGVIDTNQNMVIEATYENILFVSDNVFAVKYDSGKFGLVRIR